MMMVVVLHTGQSVPAAPKLAALYNSKLVKPVEVDTDQSTCTGVNGLKQTCQLNQGQLPSPSWDATAKPNVCNNVVSKVT